MIDCIQSGPRVAAVVAAALLISCSGRTLDDEWEYNLELAASQPLRVVDYLPKRGTPGVPKRIQPYFFFNKTPDLNNVDFYVTELGGDQDLNFDTEIDFDQLGLRYIPSQDIRPETDDATMSMDLVQSPDPLVRESLFEMRLPPGRYFNASTQLECTRFGGDPDHARQLNKYMEPGVYPLYVIFAEDLDETVTFPASLDLYLGPAYIRDNEQLRIFRHLGFTTPMPNTFVSPDGSFRVEQDGAFLPLDTPEGVLLLYLENMVATGKFVETGGVPEMTDFSLSGIIPTRFLRILADSSTGYSIVVSMLDLDADLNGNGAPDSASFAVRSKPTLLEPDEYSP